MKVLLVGEGPSELDGALRTFVTRLRLADAEITQDRVSRKDLHAHHGIGQGYFKRALRWMLEAQKRGNDAIILVIDEDGRSERSQELAQAQEYIGTAIRRALGVAIRTFDAWILVDEKALSKALGYQVSRQPDPENIKDPKSTCGRLIKKCNEPMERPDAYAAIAKAIDIAVLEERCPKGFAPFAHRVRTIADAASVGQPKRA